MLSKMFSRSMILRVASVAIFLLIWEIIGRRSNPMLLVPGSAVAVSLYELTISGELLKDLLTSLQAFSIGLTGAIVGGILVGLLLGRVKTAEHSLQHFINALYSTPNVAFIPLFIMWFGLGLSAKIAVIFLGAFFPVVYNTSDGVRSVSNSYVEVARAYGASERQVMSEVVAPSIIPFIMTGIRLAIGRAVVGVVVAEMFTAMTGLGAKVVIFSNFLQTANMFATVIVLTALGISLLELGKYLERRFARWKESERAF